jgi:cytosine/uracil/thiamine/allantoin permease
MWKIAVGFIVFAGLALWMLSKGGDIDMSGEKHGSEATHAPEAAASAPVAVSATPSAPASASK